MRQSRSAQRRQAWLERQRKRQCSEREERQRSERERLEREQAASRRETMEQSFAEAMQRRQHIEQAHELGEGERTPRPPSRRRRGLNLALLSVLGLGMLSVSSPAEDPFFCAVCGANPCRCGKDRHA